MNPPAQKTRDRIRELRRVRAGDLVPSPRNWRTHTGAQRQALQGVLDSVGYADAALVRELPDGRLELIDGHLRASLDPDQQIPVLILDVDQQDADRILATHDPLAAMASTDADQLAQLLADLTPPASAGPADQPDPIDQVLATVADLELPAPPAPGVDPQPDAAPPPGDPAAYGAATSLARGSVPMKFWAAQGLLEGDVLDFGCGQDHHTQVTARYDPFHHPDPAPLRRLWDVVTCNYVLNVQPADHLVVQICALLGRLVRARGRVLIAVRPEGAGSHASRKGHQLLLPLERWDELIGQVLTARTVERAKFYGFVARRRRD